MKIIEDGSNLFRVRARLGSFKHHVRYTWVYELELSGDILIGSASPDSIEEMEECLHSTGLYRGDAEALRLIQKLPNVRGWKK